MVAFADDVALIIVAKDISEVQYLKDESIEVVDILLSRRGLSLNETAEVVRLNCEEEKATSSSRSEIRNYGRQTRLNTYVQW